MSFALRGKYTVSGDRIRAAQKFGLNAPVDEEKFIEFRILSETEIMVTKVTDSFFEPVRGNGWLKEGDILAYWDPGTAEETQEADHITLMNGSYYAVPEGKNTEEGIILDAYISFDLENHIWSAGIDLGDHSVLSIGSFTQSGNRITAFKEIGPTVEPEIRMFSLELITEDEMKAISIAKEMKVISISKEFQEELKGMIRAGDRLIWRESK